MRGAWPVAFDLPVIFFLAVFVAASVLFYRVGDIIDFFDLGRGLSDSRLLVVKHVTDEKSNGKCVPVKRVFVDCQSLRSGMRNGS